MGVATCWRKAEHSRLLAGGATCGNANGPSLPFNATIQPMPKVLHIVTSLAVGGTQNHLKTLVTGLAAHGWESDVAFFKDSAMRPELTPLVGTVRQVPLGKASLPLALWQLLRIIKDGNFAIIHTHLLKADAMGAVAGMLASVPVVSTKHNDERVLLNPAIGVIHGLISRLNSRIVVISEHVGKFMRAHGRVPATSIVHIPYGIALPRMHRRIYKTLLRQSPSHTSSASDDSIPKRVMKLCFTPRPAYCRRNPDLPCGSQAIPNTVEKAIARRCIA